MRILSVASVSLIVKHPPSAALLHKDVLGLSFEGGEGDYVFTEKLPGVKHFGLWPLHEAATACFGETEWPERHPTPRASIEFEVASTAEVQEAAEELTQAGYSPLHGAKKEPWGQTITRLLTEDGVIVGVCYTPWFHE